MTQIQKAQGAPEGVLRAILDFMQASGVSYDKAANGEARRLAVCILALVEDTSAAPSVLGRVGLKEISFLDSSPDYKPELGLPLCGLTLVTLGAKSMNYVPRFDKSPNIKTLSFEKWWNKPVVIDEDKGINMSRKDVAYAVAASNVGVTNPKLHKSFEEISNSFPFGQATTGSLKSDMVQPLFASVRQIAYELLGSLHDRAPQYFNLQ